MKLTKVQLATFAKLKSSSGTFGTYLSLLRTRGFIELENGFFSATQLGIDYIGVENIQPPQTPEEVIAQWQGVLKGGARRIFDVLVGQYPNGLTKEQIGELTDLVPTSGTFGTYLSMLRSNSLIEVSGQEIKISDNLFI